MRINKLLNDSNKKGFTLVEVLAASVILVLVLTAIFSTYVMMSQYVKNTITQASLQGEARVAIERMVRNIREASSVSCSVSGNSITLTFDPGRMGEAGANWTSEYRLTSGQILYFPDTTLGSSSILVDNVNLDAGDQLFFDSGNGLVTIDMKLTETSLNTEQKVHLTTIVKKRNEP